ncbi:hypothetical protein ACFFLM_18055 [Deinococcus oregonensis]|uniref:Uncharacterized protein n=1 Tax=Deinococcus oregonensis TaxID=1805970 RepID=A0ABV6B2E5_9DEIO
MNQPEPLPPPQPREIEMQVRIVPASAEQPWQAVIRRAGCPDQVFTTADALARYLRCCQPGTGLR